MTSSLPLKCECKKPNTHSEMGGISDFCYNCARFIPTAEPKDIGSVEEGVIWRKEDQQEVVNHFHPTTEPKCNCASFFTVRGVHKKDCPAYIAEPRCCEKCHQLDSGGCFNVGCPCHTPPVEGEWEKEFEKLVDFAVEEGVITRPLLILTWKSFITTLLHTERERAVKDYEEKLWAACDTDADTDALSRILYKASVPPR